MAEQIYETEKDFIDLDRVVYISKQGHVSLDTYMAYLSVKPDDVEKIVNAWGAWKAFKFQASNRNV